jgi:hypothetical protein
MRISNKEWESFRAACESKGMLMRDGGTEAIRQWTERVELGCNYYFQELYDMIAELKKLVQDWQILYEEPDYGDCCRLRKKMRELGVEVIDE